MKNSEAQLKILISGIPQGDIEFIKKVIPDIELEELSFIVNSNAEENFLCAIFDIESISDSTIVLLKKTINHKLSELPVIILSDEHSNLKTNNLSILSNFGYVYHCFRPDYAEQLLEKIEAIKFKHSKDLNASNALQELEYLRRKTDDIEHRFKLLSALVSEPIVLVNQDMQVIFWNNEAQNVFGYSKYEVVSEDFLRWIIVPKSHMLIREIFQTAAESGTKKLKSEQSFFVRNKLGIEFEIESTISYYKRGHADFSLAFVFHDIQKEKRLEKEIIRTRELREENKLMREFVHTVSHDLRSPLNAIMGIAKTLLKYNSENLNERQREGLDIIYESGSQLVNMIRDLLDIVRMDRNKLELNIETIDFDKLLSIQKTHVLHYIDTKPIKFSIKRSTSIPAFIKGDLLKINQVISNLLSNAVKYTNQGKIVLSTHSIDNKLFFEIADTGIGIPKEKLNEMFNKFTQADTAFTSIGMGLGLNIAKKLVQLMHGEISIDSEKGKGTVVRFYINLPEDIKDRPAPAKEEHLAKDIVVYNFHPSKKLLLAIDDSIQHAFIYSMLSEMAEYSVLFVKNGKLGLAAINDLSPDIILLKLEIPELHGTSIIKEILRKKLNVPILAITEYEHIPISLPPAVVQLPQPFTAEQIIQIISSKKESKPLQKKYKVAVLFEEISYLKEKFESDSEKIFISNKNAGLSFLHLMRCTFDYIVFEEAYSKNNLELLFKLIDEKQTAQFKEIIIGYDGQAMKYLAKKIENQANIRLQKKADLNLQNLL